MRWARISTPFRRPRAERVRADDWLLAVGQREFGTLDGGVDEWDYSQPITLRRRITIDLQGVAEDCGIPPAKMRTRLCTTWSTGDSVRLSRIGWEAAGLADGNPLEVEFEIPGEELSSRLSVTTTLFLEEPANASGRLVPTQGSRLWHDMHTAQLEGSRGRFPMELIDLATAMGDPSLRSARWFLQWDPGQPNSSFLGSVRLFVNSKDPAMCKAIETAEKGALSVLLSEVAQHMIVTLARSSDFRQQFPEFTDGSVGAVVSEWLSDVMPEASAATLAETAEHRPGLLAAKVQALMIGRD